MNLDLNLSALVGGGRWSRYNSYQIFVAIFYLKKFDIFSNFFLRVNTDSVKLFKKLKTAELKSA